MMQVKLDKQAIDKLVEQLQNAGEDIKQQVGEEIAISAYEIESKAKRLAHKITGRLRASITALVDKDKMAAIVGTNVEYAVELEYGNQAENKRPHPYLYPAYFEEVGKLMERLTKILSNVAKG